MKKIFITAIAIALTTTFYAQVGIGTTSPNTSAVLDVESTTKGFLPPRMTQVQIQAINSPAEGLMVYCTDCSPKGMYYFEDPNWVSGITGLEIPEITNNATCAGKTISATPCTAIELANGINGGSLGNKYNNNTGGTYSVVQIGNQCWMDENIDVNPGSSPAWQNSTDEGWYGYYDDAWVASDEGVLLQWSAAMNGSTAERAQGVCPTGWHVPSDCEWMYLENTLGMTTAEQEKIGWRGTNEGTQLKVGGTSGFEGILAGFRHTLGYFSTRGTHAYYWSSSESGSDAYRRVLRSDLTTVGRVTNDKAFAWGVRCLKD